MEFGAEVRRVPKSGVPHVGVLLIRIRDPIVVFVVAIGHCESLVIFKITSFQGNPVTDPPPEVRQTYRGLLRSRRVIEAH